MTSTTFSAMPSPDIFAHDEERTRAAFEPWLHDLIARSDAHARFINTLSMLEHIGSVKIARTQGGMSITGTKLGHLAEETRHAQVLKKLARRLDPTLGDAYADDSLLAGAAARMYFARLDAEVRRHLRKQPVDADAHEVAYLLVTLLVERRAAWLYPLYQRLVDAAGMRISVRGIIGEEDRHLADVEEGLARYGIAVEDGARGLLAFESAAFARLADALYQRTDSE